MKTIKEINHWEEMINEVMHADALEVMKMIPDNSIDLVLTDPPYFEVKGDFDFVYKDFNEFLEWFEKFVVEWKRILKDNGSLYCFGHAKIIAYKQIILDKYFKLENSLVWEKLQCQTKRGYETFRSYMPVTERILFYSNEVDITGREFIEKEYIAPRNPFAKELKKARIKKGVSIKQVAEYGKFYGNVNHGGSVTNWEKGYNIPTKEQWDILKKYLPVRTEYEDLRREYEDLRKEYEHLRRPWNNNKRFTDILKFSQESHITSKWKHPTGKPEELIKELILCSSREGDIILDCFGGGFTTARCAKDLRRDFIACDLEKEYCEIGEKRLQQQTLF